jgi:DNA replicative helicase MCM subunit Mcm2 (Cdc46/Mcm family)
MVQVTPSSKEKSRNIVGPWKRFLCNNRSEREYPGLAFYDIIKSKLEWVLTPEHDIESPPRSPRKIESFEYFAKTPNGTYRLTSMLSPKVIGHNAEKLGILRSLVGSPETNIRGRIHTILIGPTGVAK